MENRRVERLRQTLRSTYFSYIGTRGRGKLLC